MNRRSAGCVRVSACGPGPKAPFSACHNKPAQGSVFTGSPAILYYSTLHNKKHLLISADQRGRVGEVKRRLRSSGTDLSKARATIVSFPPVAKVYLTQQSFLIRPQRLAFLICLVPVSFSEGRLCCKEGWL
ncbi:unknown_gene_17897 [Phodopus roborovskii]|uniref:Unknown_gene_17897 protein n=1 Tax=Phodopus roborovskii TaxID=109678 RepID=A0AAU9YRQ8_PHORO|nr:unknown_gene_17897 [Phodopus roborovskii]